jgi:hypothetical protein
MGVVTDDEINDLIDAMRMRGRSFAELEAAARRWLNDHPGECADMVSRLANGDFSVGAELSDAAMNELKAR